jgi:hypothetical protein
VQFLLVQVVLPSLFDCVAHIPAHLRCLFKLLDIPFHRIGVDELPVESVILTLLELQFLFEHLLALQHLLNILVKILGRLCMHSHQRSPSELITQHTVEEPETLRVELAGDGCLRPRVELSRFHFEFKLVSQNGILSLVLRVSKHLDARVDRKPVVVDFLLFPLQMLNPFATQDLFHFVDVVGRLQHEYGSEEFYDERRVDIFPANDEQWRGQGSTANNKTNYAGMRKIQK